MRLSALALTGLVLTGCGNDPVADTPFQQPRDVTIVLGAASKGAAAFSPNTFTTTVGARVTWFDDDTTFHVVTGDNGNWIGSNMGTNSSFTTVFTQPGTYAYHCGFHPTMVGTIIVNP